MTRIVIRSKIGLEGVPHADVCMGLVVADRLEFVQATLKYFHA